MSDHGRAHATLSPSSAERWLVCPASIRMADSLGRTDDGGNAYADEGTRAHNLAEIEAAYTFDLITKREYDVRRASWLKIADKHGDDVEEMERHVATYVSMLQDLRASMGTCTVRLEVKVQTGVPGCWGTADAALIGVDRIEVVDFKYGQGVLVRAPGNPQLRLYSLGVLELVDLLGTIDTVGMGICQPRVGDAGLTHVEMSANDLRAWRDGEVIPAAAETQDPNARFGPSEESCRWCPASGACAVRAAWITQRDFGNPDLMDEEDLAAAVVAIPEIRDWCNAIEAEALHRAYSEGQDLPGLKVVLSGGKRGITDKAEAIEVLVAAGYPRDKVAREDIETLGRLEKLVGKERLPTLLGGLLRKGEGKPALVPEDDPREKISPTTEAAKEFEAVDD